MLYVLFVVYGNKKFYLKYVDDKGDYILVDEYFNIIGIIDWEWVYIVLFVYVFNFFIGFLFVVDFYDIGMILVMMRVFFCILI